MEIFLIFRALLSLLAAFLIGYVPVYFLFEYKKEYQKEYNKNVKTRDTTGCSIIDPGRPISAADISGFHCKPGFNNNHNISKQIFIFFISIYFGFFIISNYLILLSLLGIKFSFLNAAVFSLIFCAACIFIKILKFLNTKKGRAKEHVKNPKKTITSLTDREGSQKDIEGSRPEKERNQKEDGRGQEEKTGRVFLALQAIFAFLIFVNFCVVAFFTFLFPIRFWDAISCWSLKGRAFFLDGTITAFYIQHQYTFTHLTYPLYVSLSQTWIYIWLGGINETLVKAIFPLFYLSLIFIVYYLLRKEAKRLYAIISVFILSTIPVIMDHGYLEYTNLMFSVILLLAVYYFYSYVLKCRENYKNDNREDCPAQTQNIKTHTKAAQNHSAGKRFPQNQFARDRMSKNHPALNPGTQGPTTRSGLLIWDNHKNLIISAVFFAILVSIRSEGILFLVIFLIINSVNNLAVLARSLSKKNVFPIAGEVNLTDGSRSHELDKTTKSGISIGINDSDVHKAILIKSIKSSKKRNTVITALVSIALPAALIFLLLAPWIFLQAKLNISGASTEWAPVIKGLKDGLNNILNGIVFVPGSLKNISNGTATGGSNEILGLFSFNNASGAFLGEFLFSKFDSARAFLGSSYGIAWIVLAAMAVFNFKKLFKAFNWIFFIFLSAGFIALFIALGFIPEFAWSTERYMLHLFPLAYFWIMRPYLSSTILLKSFAPEK